MALRLRYIEGSQYFGLLLVLVGTLFGYPYFPERWEPLLLSGLLTIIPAMAVVALVESRQATIVGIILGIPATAAIIASYVDSATAVSWFGMFAPLLFYAYATVVICYHVVSDRSVSADTLLGAVCGYLMLGYTWGVAYATLVRVEPRSFAAAHGGAEGWALPGDMFYFSFVTLSTLGYGDILPVDERARSLAMMEAVTGVLYLAVLVARLVGLMRAVAQTDDP